MLFTNQTYLIGRDQVFIGQVAAVPQQAQKPASMPMISYRVNLTAPKVNPMPAAPPGAIPSTKRPNHLRLV